MHFLVQLNGKKIEKETQSAYDTVARQGHLLLSFPTYSAWKIC